jgi:hypothetical protein
VWRAKADALLKVATSLESQIKIKTNVIDSNPSNFQFPFDLIKVYFMLIAFAAENMFKSKLVKQAIRGKKKNLLAVKKLPKWLKSHNLIALAKQAKISLKPKEVELLERLTIHATWAARYPIPIKFEDLKPRGLMGSDVRKLKQLIANLRFKLWRGH